MSSGEREGSPTMSTHSQQMWKQASSLVFKITLRSHLTPVRSYKKISLNLPHSLEGTVLASCGGSPGFDSQHYLQTPVHPHEFKVILSCVEQMFQQVIHTKPAGLNSVSRTHKVERENHLPQVALWPIDSCVMTNSYKYINKKIKMEIQNKVK